jgi:hypothetical protein
MDYLLKTEEQLMNRIVSFDASDVLLIIIVVYLGANLKRFL